MPPWGPPGRMPAIIDLTSDDIDVPSSGIIDLTSVEDPRPTVYVSHDPEVKVEDESSTLVGSSTTDSGKSSPKTQQDDGTAPTNSNPTDLGDPSPRNTQIEGSSSSEEDLPTILARNRKRKNAPGDAPTSEPKSSDTHFSREALAPFVGLQSQKPGFDNFWSIHNCPKNDPSSAKAQQDGALKTQQDKRVRIQQERRPTNNANPHVLNIVRDEVFGPEKNKKKHHSKPSTQQEPTKRQSQVDGQPFHIHAPRRATSETPEIGRSKKKIGNFGVVKPQPREEIESQRPHKRRKLSVRDDTTSSSKTLAAAPNINRIQRPPVDPLQCSRSVATSVEASRAASEEKGADIHRGSSRYRPGAARPRRENKAAHTQRRQHKQTARAWERAKKSERAGSGRQQGERAYMVAAQNERGQWKHSDVQRAAISSQRLPKSTYDRRATSGRDWGHHEAHQKPYRRHAGTTGAQVQSQSDIANTAAVGQVEEVQEDQEIPEARSQQSQQVQGNYDQQESLTIQSKLNAAQLASRLEQLQKTMNLDTRKNSVEEAKHFFENHPSNLALQRRVEMVDFVPPDVSKPNFAFRRQMIKGNNGKRSGRKFRTAAQNDEKRDRDRQRQVLARRKTLEAQVNQVFPNESEEIKEKWIEDGIAKLRQTFAKNDQKREAQKSQGLLTVEDLEEIGGSGGDRVDRRPAAAPKGKRRGIPVAEALEPGATITLYVVYISDPVEKSRKLGEHDMKRLGDQFLRKEDANKHAEAVLRDERHDNSHLVSVQFHVRPEDGLFWGTKELADGKLITCLVQRERQMSSYLDIGDIFVRKELKETYRSRFDVFYTNIFPKVFLENEEDSNDQSKKKKSKSKSKSVTSTTDAAEEQKSEEKEHVDEDRDSLFSEPSTPGPQVAHDERAEAEEDEQDDEGDESDADSVATDETLAPSNPGGNLSSLSWHDVIYMHEHVCGFTTLELANEEAAKVALKLWRPRGTRIDPWLHYKYAIKPSVEEAMTEELDVKEARFEFDVPEFEGQVNDRPWPFIYSTVFVKETKLEGPRDIGNYIVMDNEDDSGEEGEEDGEDD